MTKPLTGKTLVITGTLSVPRAEFARLLEDAGAKIATTVNGKTDMLVVGDDPGSKVELAESLGVSRVSEAIARAMAEGQCGITKMGPFTQKVYGASDDLVELTGCVDEELGAFGTKPVFVRFTNGTYVKMVYTDEGIWRAQTLATGNATVRKMYGIPDMDDNSGQQHGDGDAPSYSDVLIIESGQPIELESWGREPLKEESPGVAVAKRVIKVLDGFGGFDGWWNDIDQDDKMKILEAVAKVIDTRS